MDRKELREKVLAAQNLLASDSITRDTFESVRTLLKGVHPKLDEKLAVCSKALSAYGKLEKGEVIELTAEALPEKTEEDKKRKRALLLFIRSWKDLQSEIERVESELEGSKGQSTSQQAEGFGKIIAVAKGPLGIITIAAVAIVIGFRILTVNTSKSQPRPQPENLTTSPAKAKIQVIEFQGKKIALAELVIGKGLECDNEEHYHAKDHTAAKALDGTMVTDPGGCGFGKVKTVKVLEIEQ